LREIELLVEAGFSPEQAIKIATYNGAFYLGLQDRIGSVAAFLASVGSDHQGQIVTASNCR
jgi:adenine deaminase